MTAAPPEFEISGLNEALMPVTEWRSTWLLRVITPVVRSTAVTVVPGGDAIAGNRHAHGKAAHGGGWRDRVGEGGAGGGGEARDVERLNVCRIDFGAARQIRVDGVGADSAVGVVAHRGDGGGLGDAAALVINRLTGLDGNGRGWRCDGNRVAANPAGARDDVAGIERDGLRQVDLVQIVAIGILPDIGDRHNGGGDIGVDGGAADALGNARADRQQWVVAGLNDGADREIAVTVVGDVREAGQENARRAGIGRGARNRVTHRGNRRNGDAAALAAGHRVVVEADVGELQRCAAIDEEHAAHAGAAARSVAARGGIIGVDGLRVGIADRHRAPGVGADNLRGVGVDGGR